MLLEAKQHEHLIYSQKYNEQTDKKQKRKTIKKETNMS